MAAVASFRDDFVIELQGRASGAFSKAVQVANGICGLGLFAMVAAIRALGDQLRGKKMGLFWTFNTFFH